MEKILSSPGSPRIEIISFLFLVIRAEKKICWLNLPPGQGPKGQRVLNAWGTGDNVMLRVCLHVHIQIVYSNALIFII